MKKKLLIVPIILPLSFFSQVGINTTNPQGVFHVDGGKDNIGIPEAIQQKNDFIVNTEGKVGVGTIIPNSKLQVNGSLSMPIVTTDTNYVLTESDYTVIFTGLSVDLASQVVFTIPDPSTCKGRIYNIISLNGGINGHRNINWTEEYGLILSRPIIYAKLDDGTILSSSNVFFLGNSSAHASATKGYGDRIIIQSDGINWYLINY